MTTPITFVPAAATGSRSGSMSGPSAGGTAVGRLASTLVSVAVAGAAEPGRLRRGRDYLADGAVLEVEVAPGSLHAKVQGSAPEPYRVTVRVAPVELEGAAVAGTGSGDALERSTVTALAPHQRELDAMCTCRDPDRPCKHAVAALLALADELGRRPDLLLVWRADGGGAPSSTTSSVRGPRGATPGRPTERTPALDTSSPAWRAFLGTDLAPFDPPRIAGEPPHGSLVVDGVDIGLVVRSAIAAVVGVLNDADRPDLA